MSFSPAAVATIRWLQSRARARPLLGKKASKFNMFRNIVKQHGTLVRGRFINLQHACQAARTRLDEDLRDLGCQYGVVW